MMRKLALSAVAVPFLALLAPIAPSGATGATPGDAETTIHDQCDSRGYCLIIECGWAGCYTVGWYQKPVAKKDP